MDDLKDIEEKFKRLLNGFLHENFKVVNDVYFEMLLSHLSGKTGKDYSALLQLPFVLEWFEKCLEKLHADFKKVNPQVVSFMLRLITIMADNEWSAINLRDRRFADKTYDVVVKNKDSLSPSIKLSHIKFLTTISNITLGLGWIKGAKAWTMLIEYCQQYQTIYVFRESKELLSEILYKFSVFSEKTHNEELVLEILTQITKPITDSVYRENSNGIKVTVDDMELQRKLAPTLSLLCHILKKTLEKESKTKIVYYLETYFNFEKNLFKLADMTQNEEFLSKILCTLTTFNYARLIYEKWNDNNGNGLNHKMASEDFNQFGVSFYNLFKFCTARKSIYIIIRLAELNHILWKKLGNRAPEEILIENERIKFENQIITFHLVPVLFKLNVVRNELNEEFIDNYLMKLFTISCGFTHRVCYAFRDILFECPDKLSDLANKSIHGIISMENVLDQDRAVLVFQGLVYCLKQFIPYDMTCSLQVTSQEITKSEDQLIKIPNVLFAALVGLQTLIQKYRITWKETIESTCLMNLTFALLKNPNLTSRLAVQAIKLTQLSIEHFLSPNLALLIENMSGSGMQYLGPMIVKRLHDNAWEVRDSTLELVTSIANISQLKFPVFQSTLLDNGICPIVFSMVKNDSEAYVRASALKCMCQMIVINLLWEESLSSFDIVDHLLTALFVETEGIVRKEAVMLLTIIYCHRKIPTEKMNCVFSTLTHCSVSDLHWEVKINALYFWKVFISHQFTNQGMIDGTFPTVTFSKEKKKIVTLNDKEILLRIHKILNDLSDHGCLGIILECLNDDCDLEVIKVAVIIVKKLLEYLNKYDYIRMMETNNFGNDNNGKISNNDNKNIKAMNTPQTTNVPLTTSLLSSASPMLYENNGEQEITNSDDIIESIVSSNDINLLASAYKSQMLVDQDEAAKFENDGCSRSGICKVDECLYKKYSHVKPKEFLNKINSLNIDEIINKRCDWIMSTESFESLLDDMLFSIKTLEVNDADCY